MSQTTLHWLRGWMVLLVTAVVAAGLVFVLAPTDGDADEDDQPTTALPQVADAGGWYCAREEVIQPSLPDLVREVEGEAGDSEDDATEADDDATPQASATPTDDASEPTSPEDPQPTSGPPVVLDPVASSRLVAVRPPTDDEPADVTTRLLVDGAVVDLSEVFPGSSQSLDVGATDSAEVQWQSAPVSVHRLSRVTSDPSGVLVRPCSSTVSRTWYVPGMSTANGIHQTLRITNPLTQPAAVRIEAITPLGTEDPQALQNISVPSGSTVALDVNEYLPQQADMALVVSAESGRVTVDGASTVRPTVSGISGRAAVSAVSEPATRWFVPWVSTVDEPSGRGSGQVEAAAPEQDPTEAPEATATPTATEEPTEDEPTDEPTDEATGDPTDEPTDDPLDITVEGEAEAGSWVWVANPDETRAATVSVTWLTARGRLPADLLGSVEVPAGTLRRIDLTDLLPEEGGDVGLDVEVTNDVPVVVGSAVVADAGKKSDRTGLATLPALSSADAMSATTSIVTPRREHWLTITNPFGEATTVDVSTWNGTTRRQPDDLQDLPVPGGATVSVDLTPLAEGATVFSVFAAADGGGIVTNLRGLRSGGDLMFSSTHGVGPSVWSTQRRALRVGHETGLVNRLGTGLGLPAGPRPTPDPTPTVDPEVPTELVTPAPGNVPTPPGGEPTPSGPVTTPTPTPPTEG